MNIIQKKIGTVFYIDKYSNKIKLKLILIKNAIWKLLKKKPSQDSQEEPKDENEIKEVPSETKPSYQRFYKSKSFIPKFKGKSIKS